MAAMFGANLEDLQSLASLFDGKVEEVKNLQQTVGGRVERGATAWEGPGADRFRGAWNGEFAPALENLAVALGEAAAAVRKYHANIEMATR
jgi:WXG100 family type VII secretion target